MFKEAETGSANKQHRATEEPVTQETNLRGEMHRADENKENDCLACNRSQNVHAIFSEEAREACLGKRRAEPDHLPAGLGLPSKQQPPVPFLGLQQPRVSAAALRPAEAGLSDRCPLAGEPATRKPRRHSISPKLSTPMLEQFASSTSVSPSGVTSSSPVRFWKSS